METESSAARRALLQRYLRGKPLTANRATIPRRTSDGPAPLSYSQQQIWMHSHLAGDVPLYNEPITIQRHGQLDRRAFERSFTQLVRRHEAWRTTFEWRGERAVQIVRPAPAHIAIPAVDLRNIANAEAEALRLATADALKPYDLARGPLYRLRIVSLGENEHRIYITLHHLIFDGVSLYRVMLPELLTLYESFCKGEKPTLPPLPIQYADYAAWQREMIKALSPEQLAYWRNVCADAPLLELKTDKPRPAVQSYAGAALCFEIPKETAAALKSLSQQHGATPFMTLFAAFLALLHEYSGQEDIVLGGISSGRQHAETLGLLGCFLNTLPIRCTFAKTLPFIDLLARVRTAVLGAVSHEEAPFELLVQNFARKRDPSRAPLVQALIVMEPPLDPLPQGWEFTHMDVDTGTAKFDLQLGLDDRPDALQCRFIYNTDLFERSTIERLSQRWLQLLDRIVATPDETVAGLTSAASPEYIAPRAKWHGRRTNYPRDRAIHELFEEQARRNPCGIALVCGDMHVSYDELNRRANLLARALQERGVGRDVPVGVQMARSLEMIVALLAVLKAGGAYVPLDPAYPAQRIAFMIEDAQAHVVLTERALAQCRASDDSNLSRAAGAEDPAYIMYTSGSTGTPKGVAVPHRAVVRLVRDTNYATFSSHETFLQLAPISFDASTFEIWGALLNGAKLVLAPTGVSTLEQIGATVRDHRVTTLWLTSALFNAMVDERLADLRGVHQLLAGGDVLSVAHVRKALRELPNTRLINGYGPTESTTFACCYTIPRDIPADQPVPIGRPIANTTVYILDEAQREVAVGETGELCIGGDGLARGYWRRPELSDEKFVANPFESGARLYRTGDLARWRSDGTIAFLGRKDEQIKLRGFRIEPGEIEAALREQPHVQDAAVLLRGDALVAYVAGAVDSPALEAALRHKLPDYMIPSAFVSLSGLPRTANGKVDRAALPAPLRDDGFQPPSTPLEQRLAQMWMELLGVGRIGVTENFFELGGDSLRALRFVNRLREQLGLQLSITSVFAAPTIKEMAALLQQPAVTREAPHRIGAVDRAARRTRRSL